MLAETIKREANRINWIIHLVNDVYCDMCENSMDEFLPYACNAHTHGMQQYQHPDFQLVLMLPPEEIGRILNTLGMRVQRGESFHDGEYISGIYEDCQVRLNSFEESGRNVLRVIIPDADGLFPEERGCMETYKLQLLQTDALLVHNTSN